MDPNKPTLDNLKKATTTLGIYTDPGIGLHFVEGAASLHRGKAILQPRCDELGYEGCHMSFTNDTSVEGTDVYTIDGLREASPEIAKILDGRKKPIDILHIDTEGNDPYVSG